MVQGMLNTATSRAQQSRERRRHPRTFDRPIHLHIDGKDFETHDWSLGGVWLDGSLDGIAVGSRVSGTIRVTRNGTPGHFDAEVVCISENSHPAIRFLDISTAVLTEMRRHSAA